MLYPPMSLKKDKKPNVSLWHKDIGELLSSKTAKVPPGDLAVFCKKVSFLLGAGLPIKEALPVLFSQTKGRMLKQVLPDIHNKIMQGESFSHALLAAGVFPGFLCGFISIGEKTARLPYVCEQLADYYERLARTQEELTAALLYPAVVSLMMLGVIILAVVVVLPGYSQVFEHSGVTLPVLTRGLLRISGFVTANALRLVFGFFAAFFVAVLFLRNQKGRDFVTFLQLKSTLFRLGLNLRLVQVLSLMLGAGQSVSEAMPLCAEVMDNDRIKKDLSGVSHVLSSGQSFWSSLTELPYIDPLLIGLARVGEETGTLPQTITQCQSYFSDTYRKTLRRLNKIIEPVITLVLGILLALVMLAVVLPTFEMATAI